jgi:hypothetical protein
MDGNFLTLANYSFLKRHLPQKYVSVKCERHVDLSNIITRNVSKKYKFGGDAVLIQLLPLSEAEFSLRNFLLNKNTTMDNTNVI